MYFPIVGPQGEHVYPIRNDGDEGCWRWGTTRMHAVVARGDAEFEPRGDGTYVVYEKIRSTDPRAKPYRTWLTDVGTTAQGSTEVKALFDGRKVFDFPKPVALLKHLIRVGASGSDDIILDFFAGSGTTAHATLEANLEDGLDRRYICVELPMPTPEGSEARTMGLETISQLCRERIRRATAKVAADFGDPAANGTGVTGFRAFDLSSSNFRLWESGYVDEADLSRRLGQYAENVLEGRSAEAILYELVLKLGGSLGSSPVRVAGDIPEVWRVPDLATVVCLASELDAAAIKSMLELGVDRLLCVDGAFRGHDDIKTNALLQAKALGVRFATV